jgi:AcrR family transcriptional regulator
VEGNPLRAASPDRRLERREAKQASILSAAWSLARRDGLAAISLRELGEAVGLRQPSLYVYFASKLDLYDAMFADGYRKLLEVVKADQYTGPPRQALTDFVADCVRFSSDDVVRHQLLFQRTIPGFEPSAESYELALEFYEIAQDLLRAAGARTPADVDVFSAIVTGLAHQQIANDPGGERWVRHAGRVVEMFLTDIEQRQQPGTNGGDRRPA